MSRAPIDARENANKTLQGIKTKPWKDEHNTRIRSENANKTLQGIKTRPCGFDSDGQLCENANKTLQGIKTRRKPFPAPAPPTGVKTLIKPCKGLKRRPSQGGPG